MQAISRIIAGACGLVFAIGWCCCPPIGEPSTSTPEPPNTGGGPVDLGPTGPAPWVGPLPELAQTPTGQPYLHVERGETFDIYSYDFGLGTGVSSSLLLEGTGPRRKWMFDGDPLPAPGLFAPPLGLRFLAHERIIMGDRYLYAIATGPLVGWYLIVDADAVGPEQLHVVNRAYLRGGGGLTSIARAGGVH